jgi:hypothetical protein
MHRSHSVLRACVVLALVLLPSCTSCCLKPEDRCSYVLTCVEIDRSLLQNAGSLPIYRKSDGSSFGSEPVAQGVMQATRDGLWTVSVRFRETVVALAGRTAVHEYDVLTLAGKADSSGQRICAQGALPANVMTGIATEVYVTKISDTKLRVQASTREKRLPYIFTFDRAPAQARPVTIPQL